MIHVLFMGNSIASDNGRSTNTTTAATTADSCAMDKLEQDVERLKVSMKEKDSKIDNLGQAVNEIRVSYENWSRKT